MGYRRNTEYRTSFHGRPGGTGATELRESWARLASYRSARRLWEHRHTPFDWHVDYDSEDDEDFVHSDDTVSEPSTGRRAMSVPLHKYKHEKYTRAYREKLLLEDERRRLGQLSICDAEVKEKQATPPAVPADVSSPHTTAGASPGTSPCDDVDNEGGSKKDVRDIQKKGKNHHSIRRSPRPKKPTYKKPLPPTRPMSAPIGRPARKSAPTAHRSRQGTRSSRSKVTVPREGHSPDPRPLSPFAPYGYKNREKETAHKMTHNVLAAADVYPAAQRAWRRRQIEIEQHEKNLRVTPFKDERRRALSESLARRENSVWDSEYRRAYKGYDEGLYERNILQRHDPRLVYQSYVTP